MDTRRELAQVPPPPDTAQPQIGIDQWVAEAEGRRMERSRLRRAVDRVPSSLRLVGFVALASSMPFLLSQGNLFRYGLFALLYALLGLGLNVTVGFAGLLDLGYIAFYGFGAYAYAMLASPKFGIHWNTLAIIPVVMVASALLGFLVALPSRRLLGDYLAIVTLFFGQLFVTVFQNGERISVLGFTRGFDVTGGPNGITDIDNFNLGGLRIGSVEGYYYTALVIFGIVLTCVYLVDRSRTGRAWRSLREDPLAAELMGIPVNRQKLIAFACGAAIAGLTGTIFAALNTAVFAANFDVPTLIIVYAVVILGGAGSIGGLILGAMVVNISLEVLRTPGHATYVFYFFIVFGLVMKVRPWRWFWTVFLGTIAFGYAVYGIASAVWPRGVDGVTPVTGWLGSFLDTWQLHPTNPTYIGNLAFIALVFAVLGLTLLQGWMRWVGTIPTIYLASFVWDNRLVYEPSITRLILLGVILIVLMNARPQGLMGTARVEIV